MCVYLYVFITAISQVKIDLVYQSEDSFIIIYLEVRSVKSCNAGHLLWPITMF